MKETRSKLLQKIDSLQQELRFAEQQLDGCLERSDKVLQKLDLATMNITKQEKDIRDRAAHSKIYAEDAVFHGTAVNQLVEDRHYLLKELNSLRIKKMSSRRIMAKDRPNVVTEYLGDGVYITFDGFGAWLAAEDGIQDTDGVYLEPAVFDKLKVVWERAKEPTKNRKSKF